MEPCTHYGLTPPCTNIILKKRIRRVFYSFDDIDERTAKKSKLKLSKRKIKVYKKNCNDFSDFYQSYFLTKKKVHLLLMLKLQYLKIILQLTKTQNGLLTLNLDLVLI